MTRKHTIRRFDSPKKTWRWAITSSLFMLVVSYGVMAKAETTSSSDLNRFHLRFGVGLVFTAEAVDGENAPISYSTAPGILDCVQLGGRVNENVSLFFQADSLIMFQPEELDFSVRSENMNGDEVTYGFLTGIGIGYHGLPKDFYLSGAIGMGISDVVIGGDAESLGPSRMGIGFSTTFGKTWWSTNGLNLGIGGQFLYLATQGDNTNRLGKHTAAFGALLVASFN